MALDTTLPAGSKRRTLLPIIFWILFASGVALQIFSPHLAIEHNAFVLPPSTVASASAIDPRALVQRQRIMQASSALLVVVGAVGLGILYRKVILQSFSRS